MILSRFQQHLRRILLRPRSERRVADDNGAVINVRVLPTRILKLKIRLSVAENICKHITLSLTESRGLAKFLLDHRISETFLWTYDSQKLYHLKRFGGCVNIVSSENLLHIPESLTTGLAAILERETTRLRRLQDFGLL